MNIEGNTTTLKIPPLPMNVMFHDVMNDNAVVGEFSWDINGFVFKGNHDKSAKLFIDYCKELAEGYIEENFRSNQNILEAVKNCNKYLDIDGIIFCDVEQLKEELRLDKE